MKDTSQIICPRCKSESIITRSKKNSRYSCKECGKWFRHDSVIQVSSPNKDSTVVSGTNVRSLEDLLAMAKVDTKVWVVDKFVINTWQNSFQIKAWLKKKTIVFNPDEFKNEIVKDIISVSNKVNKTKYKNVSGSNMLEINIFDLHFGKLGWGEETGENYDSKIASKRFLNAIVDLVEKAKMFKIDQIVFPLGNDFFNADSAFPYTSTTAGTPQEEDLRWQKVFREGKDLIIEGINYCSKIAPVHVPIIVGNHDTQRSTYLGYVIEAFYSNNQNVSVDNSPATRKYYRYHNTLIGFTHGNSKSETQERLLQMMPQEVPHLWASTKFREWHLGDIHHKKVFKLKSENDFCGQVIRYMRSLSGNDAWHSKKGFKGAVHGAEAYVHSKNQGIAAIFNYNIEL